MSQTPAIPKKTRFLQLLAIKLLGRPLQLGTNNPVETTAMTLCSEKQGETWNAPEHVTFLIPLVGPDMVQDWSVVERLLNTTLSSFATQTNHNWRAVVCCQVAPDLPDDARVSYLQFDRDVVGNDKWSKLSELYKHLAGSAKGAGLCMTFDADDIAHPELVETLLTNPTGSLMTHGIVHDVQRDRLAQGGPQTLFQPGAKAFWKLCGSCAALPYDANQDTFALQMKFMSHLCQHEHRMVPYLAALGGHSLKKQKQSLVLYLLNHGENFGARRGRVNFKTRFVDRFEIMDETKLKVIRSHFNLAK